MDPNDVESMAANFIARNGTMVWEKSPATTTHRLNEKLSLFLHLLYKICAAVKIPPHSTSVRLTSPSAVSGVSEQQILFDFSKDLGRGLAFICTNPGKIFVKEQRPAAQGQYQFVEFAVNGRGMEAGEGSGRKNSGAFGGKQLGIGYDIVSQYISKDT
ncbi:hypothetical protein LTR67_011098 [Exophiala xenobiotica]